MKKIILAVIAVMTFGWANAQDVKFGIKGGVDFHKLTKLESASMKTGFVAGAFAEFKVSENFAFQPEILYSAQGVRVKYSKAYFSSDEKVNLGYLNVPLMFKYYVIEGLNIEAGPQIGFLLSAKSKYKVTDDYGTVSSNDDIKRLCNSVDFGLNFGLGYDVTKNLSVGARYNLGLTNVYKSDYFAKAKNSVISLTVGYKF
ncbi:porin family protein [Flavobacterium gelatinilyticum]|uniref:porin family protein n=1 Tax=Flavobacterium gelatinilyticum TaxID=3003260 RepID=UPI00247FD1E4|nr:porin family protein [Flavobacterium gelatinilyticum]